MMLDKKSLIPLLLAVFFITVLAGKGFAKSFRSWDNVLEEEGVISEESALISKYIDREDLATVLTGHKLMSLDNVIVTPHNAFNSSEALNRIFSTAVENIRAWEKGKPKNLLGS